MSLRVSSARRAGWDWQQWLWRLTPAVLAEIDEICPAPRFPSLNGTIGTAKKILPSHQVVLVALRSDCQYCYRMCTFNVYLESHRRFITKKQRQTSRLDCTPACCLFVAFSTLISVFADAMPAVMLMETFCIANQHQTTVSISCQYCFQNVANTHRTIVLFQCLRINFHSCLVLVGSCRTARSNHSKPCNIKSNLLARSRLSSSPSNASIVLALVLAVQM